MKATIVAVLAACCIGWACIPTPTPNPLPLGDAGQPDAASCVMACARMAALGCPEMGVACVPTCEHVVGSRITAFDPECVAASTSVSDARKCPAVRCGQ